MSSTPSIRPISQSWRSGRAGAKPTPQLPMTTEVTPCQALGASTSSQVAWPSKWVWMSTHPGVTSRPSASMVWRAAAPPRSPTSVMRPSSTATSAVRAGAPVPSTTVPPVTTRSCMVEPPGSDPPRTARSVLSGGQASPGSGRGCDETRTGSTIGGVSDHPDLDGLGHPGVRRRQPLLRGSRRLHPPPRPGPRAPRACSGARSAAVATTSSGAGSRHAVTNPTFDPIAMPGAMHDYFRGNPGGRNPLEMLAQREPIRPAYRGPAARLATLDEQGLDGLLAVPHAGHDLRGAAAPRPRGGVPDLPGLQPLAGRGLDASTPTTASTPPRTSPWPTPTGRSRS